MPISTQPYKGARDFYPIDMRVQNYIFDTWHTVCQSFGYEEYSAPILEPTELYLSKGNEEIIQDQTYTFEDRGKRSVTLRTEMTPTVSRMVAARRQELAMPLRLYSIPQCWRYERMQRGRGREFYQLNVDLFGVANMHAEAEIISCSYAILKAFKATDDMFSIRVSSRKLVNYLLQDILGLDQTQASTMIQLIDRMHKMEYGEFVGRLDAVFSPVQREANEPQVLLEFLKTTDITSLPEAVRGHDSVMQMQTLFDTLQNQGITNAVFDPTLMRGFEYYTDIVFEVFDTHPDNNRAMFGGGRYDDLMSLFGAESLDAIGFGMGDITLRNFLESHGLLPELASTTDIYVGLIGDVATKAQPAISSLREMGVSVAVDITGRKPDKQIKAALKKDVRYVMFIGDKEIEANQFSIKNLQTGKEEKHSLERIVSIVKDRRSSDRD